jgi:hypothetical protein
VTERPAPDSLWTDYPSFRAFVIRDCLRLGRPAPDDKTLGDAYIDRRISLAHQDAADEVASWNDRYQQRRGRGQ